MFLISGSVNTNGIIIEAYNEIGKCLNEYTGKSLKDLPSNLNFDVTVSIRTVKGNMLRVIRRCNPMAKTKDRITVFRTNICRSKLTIKADFQNLSSALASRAIQQSPK